MLVDVVDKKLDIVDRRLRHDTVSKVENMARSAVYLIQQASRVLGNNIGRGA